MKNLKLFLLILLLSGVISYPADSKPAFPLKVSQNGRYLVDKNNAPFFWVGDTQWAMFKYFTSADAEQILEDRAGKGFNAIQTMIFGAPGAANRPNVYGESPFLDKDPLKPNEKYFLLVDSIIKIAESKGLVIVLGVYHKVPDYTDKLNIDNARRWAHWIANRYKNNANIIWSMFPEAKDSYLPIVRELVAGLKEGDGGNHLITVHPDPAAASSSWIHSEKWLDFNTCQTWKSDFRNYKMVAIDYNKTPAKPAVNGEARYEGEASTVPFQIRNGAYWSCMAGGFYSYGHGGNWMSPKDWRTWIDAPGTKQIKVMGEIFRSFEWWKLVPDNSVIGENDLFQVAARASDNSYLAAYLPDIGEVTVNMEKLEPQKVRAVWISPVTGKRIMIGTFNNKGKQTFTTPQGWTDAFLLLTESREPVTSRLSISKNKRYFVDETGKPVFWIGNTQWFMFMKYTSDEIDYILQNLASKGFTIACTMIIGTGDGSSRNRENELPWFNNDPSQPNEKYFKTVDTAVSLAAQYGLYIRLGLLHNAQLKYMTNGKGKAYAKWVAARYKNAPNVLYSIHGDIRNPELFSVAKEMAEGIEEVAGKDILISQKPDPSPNTSGTIQKEKWLDFTQSQTWKWIDKIYYYVTTDYNRKPFKPTVMDEGAYESGSEYGFEVTPLKVRWQAYYSYLSGGHHTYGHNDLWRHLPTWKESLDAAGAFQMGVCKKIFVNLPEWWNLVPDQSLLVGGGQTDGEVLQLAARHDKGNWAIFYSGKAQNLNIKTDKLNSSLKFKAYWIDPRNGEKILAGDVIPGGQNLFNAPDNFEDAVLLISPASL